MTFYELLIIIHILSAMVWVGGAMIGGMIGSSIHKSGDAKAMASFCSGFASVAGPMFGGASMVVMLSGVWLVAKSDAIEFADAWISAGFAGWLVSMLMGATIVGRSWFKLGQALGAEGATTQEFERDFNRARLLNWFDVAIRIAVVVVMVTRPG